MTTSTFRYGIATQRIQILSLEYMESMIDFTLSQTAKDLWVSFIGDMAFFATKFFDFVDTGDNASAHLILKVWLLGYESACTLKSEDRWAIEQVLDTYLIEINADHTQDIYEKLTEGKQDD